MMKFREFLKKNRGKRTSSKGAEQSAYQSLEPSKPMRANDARVLIGTDCSDLPPAVIPPTIGKAG
jgi:hypothetical protein